VKEPKKYEDVKILDCFAPCVFTLRHLVKDFWHTQSKEKYVCTENTATI
jgi:hypothetical protein